MQMNHQNKLSPAICMPRAGNVTVKDVMEVLPFTNLLHLMEVKGSVLREALEHSVSEYVPGNAWKGSFLQMSGNFTSVENLSLFVYSTILKPREK